MLLQKRSMVWDRIRVHPDRKEILKVLDQELKDSMNLCFTGRVTRLVNCLNGFDSDVVIQISKNEQLNNLMVLIKKQYTDNEEMKKALIEAMKERDFTEVEITEWVGYLEE